MHLLLYWWRALSVDPVCQLPGASEGICSHSKEVCILQAECKQLFLLFLVESMSTVVNHLPQLMSLVFQNVHEILLHCSNHFCCKAKGTAAGKRATLGALSQAPEGVPEAPRNGNDTGNNSGNGKWTQRRDYDHGCYN